MSEVLALSGIEKRFRAGTPGEITVLSGADLIVSEGEIVALVAPSGSGKSTLLHIAGLLDQPDAGQVSIAGEDATQLSDRRRTAVRRDRVGFVYQFHHLLPEFSAIENIAMPQRVAGVSSGSAQERSSELLQSVGLGDRGHHRPAELSGGEQQRVALCRALANNPDLVLADEPTGNLDPDTSDQVFDLLLSLARNSGLAALIATHNLDLAARMDRIVRLENGIITSG